MQMQCGESTHLEISSTAHRWAPYGRIQIAKQSPASQVASRAAGVAGTVAKTLDITNCNISPGMSR